MIGWLLFGVVLGSILGPTVLLVWAAGEFELDRWRARRTQVSPHQVYARIVACPSPTPPGDCGRPGDRPGVPAPGRSPIDLHPWLQP